MRLGRRRIYTDFFKLFQASHESSSSITSNFTTYQSAHSFLSDSRLALPHCKPATDKSAISLRQDSFHVGRHVATKAEEYDVISVESGVARIEGYDSGGFLVNNAYLEGPIMCGGELATLWKVPDFASITGESLSLLLLMRPPPDLLVLGCGSRIEKPSAELQEWLADHSVALECLDTGNAVSTFNILNQEGRKVVAALLPSN